MKLEDAIEHLDDILQPDKKWECKECRDEHVELRDWLNELRVFKDLEKQGKLVRLPHAAGERALRLTRKLRAYELAYREPPCGREIDGTVELLKEAAETIEDLLSKTAVCGEWIYCGDGNNFPEENRKSYLVTYKTSKGRCCVKELYYRYPGVWEGRYSGDIIAWRSLPDPYREGDGTD